MICCLEGCFTFTVIDRSGQAVHTRIRRPTRFDQVYTMYFLDEFQHRTNFSNCRIVTVIMRGVTNLKSITASIYYFVTYMFYVR